MSIKRIRMTVRYDGTGFAGSQIQPNERTVAGTLKSGLEALLRQNIHLLWAGRTDTGVHANGNVASFDAELRFPPEKLPRMLNKQLPEDVEIRDAMYVADDFHPRYGAVSREYSYRIFHGTDVPVDRMRYVFGYEGGWNKVGIEDVLAGITGKHAFNNFCAGSLPPEECICELFTVSCIEDGSETLFKFVGDRFLHGMIRRLIAAILAVTDDRIRIRQVTDALSGKITFKLKPASPQGLTLEKVSYGEGMNPTGTPRVDGMM